MLDICVVNNFTKPDIGEVPPAYFPSGIRAQFLLHTSYSSDSDIH
ncbi:hypothetical protein [Acetobacter ascendens]|nr:hypothetical protein [Acetobacter ascendens]